MITRGDTEEYNANPTINFSIAKWFEPRSISCLSWVIIWVRVVFRKTVVGDLMCLTTWLLDVTHNSLSA